mgnify:CR=1 FL=1
MKSKRNNFDFKKNTLSMSIILLLSFSSKVFSQDPFSLIQIDLPCTYIQVVSEDEVLNLSLDFCIKIRDNSFIVPSDAVAQINGVTYKSGFYEIGDDTVFLLPRIVYKTDGNLLSIDDITNLYNVAILDKGHNKYVMTCEVATSQEIVSIMNILSDRSGIQWCEPEFFLKIKQNNTLYNQQYYLKNTGQNNGTIGIDINVEPA